MDILRSLLDNMKLIVTSMDHASVAMRESRACIRLQELLATGFYPPLRMYVDRTRSDTDPILHLIVEQPADITFETRCRVHAAVRTVMESHGVIFDVAFHPAPGAATQCSDSDERDNRHNRISDVIWS